MGGILQVDSIKNNNTSNLITQTNATTITIAASGQTIVIPSGTTFNASSASVNLPAINLATGVTGTLPYTSGGTGLTTLGTAGQALVVNSGATALQYSTVGATAGQVIQVVSATDSTTRSTTSSTYVTGSNTLSVSITPSSASNKILIFCSTAIQATGSGEINVTIYRNSTNLAGTGGFSYSYDTVAYASNNIGINYLDSPNTTSAITYQIYFKITSGTAQINASNLGNTGSIICMEIKG
jgi:hypothetical protein